MYFLNQILLLYCSETLFPWSFYCFRMAFRNCAITFPFMVYFLMIRAQHMCRNPWGNQHSWLKGETRIFHVTFCTRVQYCVTSCFIQAARYLHSSLWLGLTGSCSFKLLHCKINNLWFFQGMLHILLGKCTLQDFVTRSEEIHFSFTSDKLL